MDAAWATFKVRQLPALFLINGRGTTRLGMTPNLCLVAHPTFASGTVGATSIREYAPTFARGPLSNIADGKCGLGRAGGWHYDPQTHKFIANEGASNKFAERCLTADDHTRKAVLRACTTTPDTPAHHRQEWFASHRTSQVGVGTGFYTNVNGNLWCLQAPNVSGNLNSGYQPEITECAQVESDPYSLTDMSLLWRVEQTGGLRWDEPQIMRLSFVSKEFFTLNSVSVGVAHR